MTEATPEQAATLQAALSKVADGTVLSRDETARVFDVLMSGAATPAQIAGLLMAMRVRGESVDELAGAVSVMREKMLRVYAPEHAVDVVGTGGDGKGSFNVSTTTAFVVAACGVPVAKHGNRALSSKSGAADVLEALGVNLNVGADGVSHCIREAGLGFMFAPSHHAAMRFVGPARKELGVRTIFNLLGPMSNPAGVKRQLLGVFAPQWLEPMAEALKALGSEHIWVVHGSDGMDEITVCDTTAVAELCEGQIRTFTIDPEDYGIARAKPEALEGGDAAHNANALRAVLSNEPSAYHDAVIINAAASLIVAGKAEDLAGGIALANDALEQGKALDVLNKLVAVSKSIETGSA